MPGTMYFQDATVPTLVAQIKQLPCADNQIVLLLIGEHSTFNLQELWAALKAQKIIFAGGVFPGIIFGDRRYDAGIVADVLPVLEAPSVITGLDTINVRLHNLPILPDKQQYTALVLVDGLTKHIAYFLDRLFEHFGNKVSYIGGGAGSLSFKQMPCVFDTNGIYQDAALVLLLKTTTSLGVQHGWESVRGPFIATDTDGTVVRKFYNRPAFRVYSEVIKSKTGQTLTKENFFSIAKEYPLGIFHAKMDYIVRDPIAFTDDGALVCVGEVPKSSLLYILHGNKKNLIENAQLATSDAMQVTSGGQHNLIVDCISRVLYLEDDFDQELRAVRNALPQSAATPYGVLSLGEIATFKTGRVEFFNKTIVVGSLQDMP